MSLSFLPDVTQICNSGRAGPKCSKSQTAFSGHPLDQTIFCQNLHVECVAAGESHSVQNIGHDGMMTHRLMVEIKGCRPMCQTWHNDRHSEQSGAPQQQDIFEILRKISTSMSTTRTNHRTNHQTNHQINRPINHPINHRMHHLTHSQTSHVDWQFQIRSLVRLLSHNTSRQI